MSINAHFDRSSAIVTANKTLTAADSGVVQLVTADNVIITLPATALGLSFTIKNGSRYDGEFGYTVAPAAADGFTGNGFTAAVNKAAVVAKANSRAKDEFTVLGTGVTGATGYVFTNVQGVVSRAA